MAQCSFTLSLNDLQSTKAYPIVHTSKSVDLKDLYLLSDVGVWEEHYGMLSVRRHDNKSWAVMNERVPLAPVYMCEVAGHPCPQTFPK